jgi:glucose-6-phosphate isomerase
MITIKIPQTIYDKAFSVKGLDMQQAIRLLHNRVGEGNDFLGWLDLPSTFSEKLLQDITQTANYLREISECVVVVGIGGSYLGARAVITALSDDFSDKKPQIIYAGHHLSEDYYADLLEYLTKVNYSVIVVSKSGTTTEPAVAFRLLKQHCEQKYGISDAKNRIVCVTDAQKGVLKEMAEKEAYTTYEIPDDVGGRFSVFTPVGLLPIAVAGFDIQKLIAGAKLTQHQLFDTENNIAARYAMCRNYLLSQGKNIEVLSAFEPKLHYLIEWWKQLFGESEGKDGKGLFPAGMIFTTDLHSLGQYMQQGQRLMFETFLTVSSSVKKCVVPFVENNEDKLNFLAEKRISEINHAAKEATMMAHHQGEVPIMELIMEKLDEQNIGSLLYFFEYACAVSAYMLGVNPFNQPGVEAYKENMFVLLGKEGGTKTSEFVYHYAHSSHKCNSID